MSTPLSDSLASSLSLLQEAEINLLQSSELAGLSRDEIVARMIQELGGVGGYYLPEDYNDAIQDAYDEVVSFTGCITKLTTTRVIGYQTYYDMRALIPDFMSVLGIWESSSRKWMLPVSFRELDNMRDDWEIASGTPYLFCPINYRYIAVFPRPSSHTGNFHIFYKATADLLAGSSVPQVPMELAEEILGQYVVTDLYEQAMEWGKAQKAYQRYVMKIKELISFLSKRDAERFRRLGGTL